MLALNTNFKYPSGFLLLLALAVFINLCTINTAFFTDDPGLYASIAKQLIYKRNFFQLFSYGRDWLDKPHLPFWFIMFSFKLFGIHTWTYKLPALICFLLSLLYTWLFTKKHYGELTAMMAVLIVSTSLHIIMSNTDVRAEPYLMAFIIGAIYHISNLEQRFSIGQFVLAALLTAFAIMTKGIFVVVPIYGALGGQLILQKKYKEIFRIKWIALVLLTIIFIIPELYALYIQFDVHPEKTVFGRHGVSGLKWFLWDSQFGRFANNGPITRPKGDVFFFIHTLLWAFAPWCLLFYYAAFRSVRKIVKGIGQPEYYALSGGLILLILFSISSFQLPFYTNIIFPLFAIPTANFCCEVVNNKAEGKFRSIAQWVYMAAFLLVILVLHYFLEPAANYFLVIGLLCLAAAYYIIFKSKAQTHIRLFMLTCATMLFVGFYVNTTLYPVIVGFKGPIKAAEAVNTIIPSESPVYSLRDQNNIFQFYCDRPVKLVALDQLASTQTEKGAVFYVDKDALTYLIQNHVAFNIIWYGIDYPQENILPAFINSDTRGETLQSVYLIKRK
ncbi:glycosyltransferase family 39 protein [Mucilaginibacter mali]|uniref:Glycosyltransferase family 39 protein n=1 Tax=Mucilaginibacter mali TaxID=2740462 RepID=A0A7D4Q987_9SPHI|nr:glycosyltransferase family 39 protein [Mucilaginibacter mali]QKJ29985.1 glycosyltransferase family 39 protein [Mucilaginibacter mali]